MAQLIRIGNSQGLRIPKLLIEQAKLEGKELTLKLLEGGGLMILPIEKPRAGWADEVQSTLDEKGREPLDQEWLDAPLTEENLPWD